MDQDTSRVDALLDTFDALLKTVPDHRLAKPFAPPPWPRAEMNVMYRMLAGEMGLPERCPDRRCRRVGQCKGGLGRKDCDACASLWDEAARERLKTACETLILAWMTEARRLYERADMLLPDEILAESALPAEETDSDGNEPQATGHP